MKGKKYILLAICILLLLGINNNSTTAQEQPNVTKTAKDVYLEYRGKLDKCKNVEDYFKLNEEYCVYDEEYTYEQIKNNPDALAGHEFGLAIIKKGLIPISNISSIREEKSGDIVKLIIESNIKYQKDTIEMIEENGFWKIRNLTWTFDINTK